MTRKSLGPIGGLGLCLLSAACALEPAGLAPLTAQPGTRPARNFTSFSGALRCMDGMLAKAGKRRVLISSSNIPDKTKQISVGADDMLVNAVGHMNRTSKTYVFLDQGLVKDGGLIELQIAQKRPPRPQYYIRGSISQLDSKTLQESFDADPDRVPNTGSGLLSGTVGRGRTVSIVSVDLHLVAYPSRQVVPGLSVANSMAVISRGYGAKASGLINMTGLDLALEIDRIESNSQAVRNLIELGVIELLGRHSGIPYWQCLSDPGIAPKRLKQDERQVANQPAATRVSEAQQLLSNLNLYDGPIDGVMSEQTRRAVAVFQDAEGLLANGVVNYDLIALLRKRQPKRAAPSNVGVLPEPVATPVQAPAPDPGYRNLYDFMR